MSKGNERMNEYELNIDMWKHYDNLRQEKNKTFLTANTILVAAAGFFIGKVPADNNSQIIVATVAILGFVTCILWFLLQTINKAYIDYHIQKTCEIEKQQLTQWTTFENQQQQMQMICIRKHPNNIDRILSGTIAAFWVVAAVYFFATDIIAIQPGRKYR